MDFNHHEAIQKFSIFHYPFYDTEKAFRMVLMAFFSSRET